MHTRNGQRPNQRRLVDDGTAGGIDQDGRLLHLPERPLVDQVPRLGQQRGVDGDEVGLREQCVPVGVRGVELALGREVRAQGVVVQDAHPEPTGPSRYGAPDAAEAQDAERLAMHIQAPEQVPLPGLPLPGAGVLVGLDHTPSGRHQQGPGEVRSGLGEHVGGVGDDDAAPAGGGQIDVVVADSHVGDDLEVRAGGQHLVVDGRDDVADEAGLAPEAPDQLLPREGLVPRVVVDGEIGRDQTPGFIWQNV